MRELAPYGQRESGGVIHATYRAPTLSPGPVHNPCTHLAFFLPSPCSSSAQPAHRWRSSNSGDLNKIYDTATPNPTGSLSGPWFDMTEAERDVTGIARKVTHLVCRIKNLGNHTVSDVN